MFSSTTQKQVRTIQDHQTVRRGRVSKYKTYIWLIFSGTKIASVFLDRNIWASLYSSKMVLISISQDTWRMRRQEWPSQPSSLPMEGWHILASMSRLKVIPGLKLAPPPFKSDRPVMESNQGAWGMCRTAFDRREHASTSTQQTKPEIYVKSAEVKRLKRVSYDG